MFGFKTMLNRGLKIIPLGVLMIFSTQLTGQELVEDSAQVIVIACYLSAYFVEPVAISQNIKGEEINQWDDSIIAKQLIKSNYLQSVKKTTSFNSTCFSGRGEKVQDGFGTAIRRSKEYFLDTTSETCISSGNYENFMDSLVMAKIDPILILGKNNWPILPQTICVPVRGRILSFGHDNLPVYFANRNELDEFNPARYPALLFPNFKNGHKSIPSDYR